MIRPELSWRTNGRSTEPSSRHFHAYRPLAAESHFDVAKVQAQLARLVGTYIGNTLRLRSRDRLFVESLDKSTVRRVRNASRDSRIHNDRHLQALLADDLPPKSAQPLPNVEVTDLFIGGKGYERSIRLALQHPQLDSEAHILADSLTEAANINVYPKVPYLTIAHIGELPSQALYDQEVFIPPTLKLDGLQGLNVT